MISQEDLQLLAQLIIANIKKDFEIKHMSKNLVNTIYVTEFNGEIKIHIPAKTYNMLLFQNKGVVVHTNRGSYANQLNEEGSSFYVYNSGTRKGSFRISPHNHKGYIDKAIDNALEIWKNSFKEKYTMTVMK